MSHTLKVTAMETSVKVNSASLFPCLITWTICLCCRSLKQTDECLIKRTKIDQNRLIESRPL